MQENTVSTHLTVMEALQKIDSGLVGKVVEKWPEKSSEIKTIFR